MARSLETVITSLEMTARPAMRVPPPLGAVAVLLARDVPVSFFRYLYHEVGNDWHWVDRKRLTDAALADLLARDDRQIFVLYMEGVPAGFAELNWSGLPQTADLSYFGLTAPYLGRKLGPFFLAQILDILWSRGPERVTVETCTLDHPRALSLYQQAGFVVTARREHRVDVPEDLPPPPYRVVP
ncbi:MAG: GNAT family N-acetyltransferase [Alphaproteobacteria bacterium]